MQMRHFRYFIAAAEEGSFLKAASRLRVAQPSLSRQIRDLEREVGVPLFERLPRGVRLTPAGDAFLREARNTLECAARAVATARYEGAPDRTLRVAHGPLFFYARLVSKLLAAFRSSYPETHVSIRRLNETKQREALRERRIDAAVSFIGTPNIPGFNVLHLKDARVTGVVIPSAHPLAQKSAVSLLELRELTWVRTSRKTSPELHHTVRAALLSRGYSPVLERARPRDPAIASMHVATGDAWMLASEDIGHFFEEGNPALAYRPFTEEPIPCWLGLLTLPGEQTRPVERLIEVARQIL